MRGENVPERPTAPTVLAANIPAELKGLPRWVGWRYEFRDPKWEKIPISCVTGRKANITGTAGCVLFEDALNYYDRHKADGIGFVIHKDDPYTGIDLDDCRDPATGELQDDTADLVRVLDSYTEVSPSGKGVKVIVKGKLPQNCGKRKGNIEIYGSSRYFTVTGHHLEGTPTTVEDRQSELRSVYHQIFEGMTDDEIIMAARKAANGSKFARLWSGDTSGYESPSEADMALCGILAYWVGNAPERIEKLFGQSELGKRGKWVSREDYRQRTIETAIEGRITRDTRSNQITRSIQDYTRKEHTAASPAIKDGLSEEDAAKAEEMAVDLAKGHSPTLPAYDASFRLARRLRTLSTDHPEKYEKAVRAYCEKIGREKEDIWYAFLHCWPKVRMAEGDDALNWAANMAKESPVELSVNLGNQSDLHIRVASLAYHLSQLTAPHPFWLPRIEVGALLNSNKDTISKVVSLLVENGVLECVNENYKYAGRDRQAKEYRFIATPTPT